MYYYLGCIRVGKSYIKLEEDLLISSIVRLANKTQIKPQTAKFCMCKVKGNKQALHNRLHQVIPSENSILNQEPGLLAVNSIVKTTKQGKFFVLVINSSNKHITHKEGSKIRMIEPVRECDFVNVRDNLAPKTGSSPKVSSFTEIKQKIDTPSTFKETVEEIVRHNLDLFAEKDTDLDKTQTIRMTIDTGDHPPIRLKPYRTPFSKRATVDKAIDDMLAANIIQSSRSPWSFPTVVVDKKDGSKRFCIDFRKLNYICKRSSWPLPVIDDMLAVLGKSKYFTTLDLKSGYCQGPLDKRDKEKTAFTCHRGLYEYNVMPFGLANAPGVFQKLMSVVLQDLGKFAMAYLDDIIIFSPSMEEHIKHIQLVFDRLRQHQ